MLENQHNYFKLIFICNNQFSKKKKTKMYPNPFDRKHSTIRQVIDRILKPDFNRQKKSSSERSSLRRFNSNASTSSSSSTSSTQSYR